MKTKKINWKDEINGVLIAENIKRIKQMSIPRLKELLEIAMNIGYNYKMEVDTNGKTS